MPVITNFAREITDMVVQGEQLRRAAFNTGPATPMGLVPLLAGSLEAIPPSPSSSIQGRIDFHPMQNESWPLASLRSQENGALVRANASICTPCGEMVFIPLGRRLLIKDFIQATDIFTITGQTVTGLGAPLGNCRVVVYETGRIAVTGQYLPYAQAGISAGNEVPVMWDSESPVVAEAISDGSGNFTITVPMNVAYQLTGYLAGAPDRAGITKDTVVPGSVTIYMRDPTVADSPGGPGGGTVLIIVNE